MVTEVMNWGSLVGFANELNINHSALYQALRDYAEYQVRIDDVDISFCPWGYLTGKFLVTLS